MVGQPLGVNCGESAYVLTGDAGGSGHHWTAPLASERYMAIIMATLQVDLRVMFLYLYRVPLDTKTMSFSCTTKASVHALVTFGNALLFV